VLLAAKALIKISAHGIGTRTGLLLQLMRQPALKPASAFFTKSPIETSKHRQCGFTLLELLVVVVIVAILFTYTTLAIRSDSPEDIIKKEAQRIGRLIELALEESILRGEEYGIEFSTSSYRFLRFEENQWSALGSDRILRERELPLEMELELRLEETEIVMDFSMEKNTNDDGTDKEEKDEPEPQVFLLSSGEVTPEFDVRFYILGVETSYIVKANFDGSVSTEKSDL